MDAFLPAMGGSTIGVIDMSKLDDEEQVAWLDKWDMRQKEKQRLRDDELDKIRIEVYHAGIVDRIRGVFRRIALRWRYR